MNTNEYEARLIFAGRAIGMLTTLTDHLRCVIMDIQGRKGLPVELTERLYHHIALMDETTATLEDLADEMIDAARPDSPPWEIRGTLPAPGETVFSERPAGTPAAELPPDQRPAVPGTADQKSTAKPEPGPADQQPPAKPGAPDQPPGHPPDYVLPGQQFPGQTKMKGL